MNKTTQQYTNIQTTANTTKQMFTGSAFPKTNQTGYFNSGKTNFDQQNKTLETLFDDVSRVYYDENGSNRYLQKKLTKYDKFTKKKLRNLKMTCIRTEKPAPVPVKQPGQTNLDFEFKR